MDQQLCESQRYKKGSMRVTTVKINRLEIHLKGISPQTARTLVSGLGHELMTQLAEQQGAQMQAAAQQAQGAAGPEQPALAGEAAGDEIAGLVGGM